MSADLKCRGYVIEETAKAYNIVKQQGGGLSWWLPKSMMAYKKLTEADPFREIQFTLPEWLIEKNQCWDLVP